MSGGYFDYRNYVLEEIAETIRNIIVNNRDPEWIKQQKEHDICTMFEPLPKEVLKVYEQAYKIIYKANIYARRIDWFESGDDGEETFLKRTKEELEKTKQWFKICFKEKASETDDDLFHPKHPQGICLAEKQKDLHGNEK